MKDYSPLDQFFLADQEVVDALVETTSINKSDRILEIGAGTGIVTRELAKKAGKILAVEIDESFKSELSKLPRNVEIIYADALTVIEKKIKFNKIVGSLPSSLVEPLMRRLPRLRFDLGVFLVPLKFVNNLTDEPAFSAYLQTELIREVGKTAFNPQPKTNWALVKIAKKPQPLPARDYLRFAQQYLLEHPEAKVKNALMEILIRIYQSDGKDLTKNQAREIVAKTGIPRDLSENLVKEEDVLSLSRSLTGFLS